MENINHETDDFIKVEETARSWLEGAAPAPQYTFKVFAPYGSRWHENVLRLHAQGTCTTEKAPDQHHGEWKFAENGDLLVKWHFQGEVAKVKEHRYRKIERTECWEGVNVDKGWYTMLLPTIS
jgi:hypothetical protein